MVKKKMLKIRTRRPMGHRICDVGPGGKEHNVKEFNWNIKKKICGYKVIMPSFFNNIIVENKNQAYSLAKHFKVKKKDLKFRKYCWNR